MRVEWAVARVTWRLLLAKRRWILALVANAFPPLVALLFLYNAPAGAEEGWHAEFLVGMVDGLVFTVLLPLAGLIHGTSALGLELEDGTLGYVLAKPVARWRVVVAKLAVASVAIVLSVVPGVVLAGWMILGSPTHPIVLGYTAGVALASALYAALFMLLSLLTRRALILGLLYVVVWEGALSRVFTGVRVLSVREYAAAAAESVADQGPDGAIQASLDASSVAWLAPVMLAAAVMLAVARLRTVELIEEV